MMKTVALLTLCAFAFVPAVQADDAKPCDKKPACCEKAKGACPAGKAKDACPKQGEKKDCPAGKEKKGCPASKDKA